MVLGLCTVLLLLVLAIAIAAVAYGARTTEPRLPFVSVLWLLLGCVFATVAIVHFCK